MDTKYLHDMKKGQSGIISKLPEGHRVNQKLSEMGIRCGMNIIVMQIVPFNGPVIIKAGQTQIAIGHGMSSRIKVNLVK